ncbi:MAG: alpha amylase N-terminal ig-like domain-containing protein, partial [Lachnospiraceae bacterium]|nr:alpha amylase N-terminal ig-like domain-containing protein [Lachnospiraceae bacterium]
MNKEAVKHLNTEEFVYAKARDELVLRLRSAKRDLRSCKVVFFSRTSPEKLRYQSMQLMQTDQETDYFEAILHVEPVARYQKYYFELEDNAGNRYYLSPIGISETKPEIDFFEHLYTNPDDVISYPDWAKGAIYYQIFPERFCDGDETNNPKDTEPWGSTPTRENYMGGDLKGIYQKIPYLKKLGIEVIYLNPVFKGDFNHKYATTDYFHIDPIFGTNDDFARLVDELHKAGIRILLDGVFNHVGVHFDRFQDVVKRGKESPYFNWFLTTKTEDIQISHHDYECVGAYKYMPKLNTSNSDVRCFILEVMEYWIERYHIDGWRLDVADEVDMSVWQMAHMALKPKYPNILLLGETWGYGGKLVEDKKLDSVMNYMFRDAVRDYFGLEKCSGKEFCNRIGTMLGLYKKETADVLYNLIDSHDTERFLHYTGGNLNLLK